MLLRWRHFLEFYDHRETRIRATAQVVFADVDDSHRAQQELIELLSWVRVTFLPCSGAAAGFLPGSFLLASTAHRIPFASVFLCSSSNPVESV